MAQFEFNKFKEAIFNLLESTSIENWEYVDKVDFKYVKDMDSYFLTLSFKDGLKKSEEDNVLDDCWREIFDFFRVPVYLINKSKKEKKRLGEQKSFDLKKMNKLHRFMETIDITGVCGYMVLDEDSPKPQIVLIIDLAWLDNQFHNPSTVSSMIRTELEKNIKNWLNLDIPVGYIAKQCEYEKI